MLSSTEKIMGPDEARAVTERIRGSLDDIWELITSAYAGRAWIALYNESWDVYCEGRI